MKCNLSCYGCYAGYYDKKAELTFDEIERVMTQAKEMGVYFCVVSGGEPLFHPRIFYIFEKHNDIIFQMYTNASLIDENVCQRFAEVGNVIPAISVEGFKKETDERRGTVCPPTGGRKPNRKMAFSLFCQWHVCPDITLIGLTITNTIGKSSGGGLAYD